MTLDNRPSRFSDVILFEQRRIREQFAGIAFASESVMQIARYKEGSITGLGSGVLIGEKHVLSAGHVVKNAETLLFYMSANGLKLSTSFDGGDIFVDEKLDIALIPLPEIFQGYVPILKSGSLINSKVPHFLIGFPSIDNSVNWKLHRDPTIHMLGVPALYENRLIADVLDPYFSVASGASGGPIVDGEGKILGIATSAVPIKNSPINSPIIIATSMEAIQSTFASEL